MIFAPALLLFTTLTTVGLIAAWAATSRWHWFVRTMAFLGVASLPLLIPAYEMFVAFVVQGAVTAAGMQVWRWWRRRAAGERQTTRFSLQDGLLAVLPVAAILGVASRFPGPGDWEWLSALLVGLISGVAVLLGLWAAASGRKRLLWRILPACAIAALLALLLAIFEKVYPSFWELIETTSILSSDVSSPLNFYTDSIDIYADWILAEAGLVVAVALVAFVYGLGALPPNDRRKPGGFSAYLAFGATIGFAVLPGYALVRLTTPIAVPEHPEPAPNGFKDYEKALAALPNKPRIAQLVFDLEAAPFPQLRSAVEEVSASLTLADRGLRKEIWRTPTYTLEDLDSPDAGALRTLGRALVARAIVEQRSGNPDRAADYCLAGVAFGGSLSRGGLMIDSLIGFAIGGMGLHGLYDVRDSVSERQLSSVASRLRDAEIQLDSLDNIALRDKVWSQRAFGWVGLLAEELDYLRQEDDWAAEMFTTPYKRHVATIRLLQLEYALLAYRGRFGTPPERLDQLLVDFIQELPADPFGADGEAFRYKLTRDGYRLYSVWADGRDDGGEPPSKDGGVIYWGADNAGDLSLGALFDSE